MDIPMITLDDAFDRYLNRLAHRVGTRRTFSGALQIFKRYLDGLDPPVATVDQLEPSILVDFYQWLKESPERDVPYAPLTIRTYVAAVRSFLRHLRSQGELPFEFQMAVEQLHEAMQMIDRVRYPGVVHVRELPEVVTHYDKLPPSPNRDEKARARDYLVQLRNRALLYTLFSTAARISEVLALRATELDEGRARVARVLGKRDKERVLRFTDDARRAIAEYLQARRYYRVHSDYLFISHGRGKGNAMTPRQAQRVVEEAARAVGLDGKVTPHTFRHWRATQLLNDGLPAEMVAKILGHDSVATTTTIYAHYLDQTLSDAFDRHSPTITEAKQQMNEET
jgi:integrase/recombinase XerD